MRGAGHAEAAHIAEDERIRDDSARLSKQVDLILNLSQLGLKVGHIRSNITYCYKQRLLEHLKVNNPPNHDLWAKKMVELRNHLIAQLTGTLRNASIALDIWAREITPMRRFYRKRRLKLNALSGFDSMIDNLIDHAETFVQEIEQNNISFRSPSGHLDIRFATADFIDFLRGYHDLYQEFDRFYSSYADDRDIRIDRRIAVSSAGVKGALQGTIAIFSGGALG